MKTLKEKVKYEGYVTVQEFSKYLDVDKSSIIRYIQKGLIPAENFGMGTKKARWYISEYDAYEFAKTYKKYCTILTTGRSVPHPNKCKASGIDKCINKDLKIKALRKRITELNNEILELMVQVEELLNEIDN